MASPHTSLEENLRCSICLDTFKDPVVLRCTHSFCKACLDRSWNRKDEKECPLCRKISKSTPLHSLSLKNTCDSFIEAKKRRISAETQGMICLRHAEKQQLFCVDDQQLVCMQCIAQDHQEHNFCSISKVASEHKIRLHQPRQELQTILETLKSEKDAFGRMSTEQLQSQVQKMQKQIKEEFEKLHEFLREEEKARTAALKEEEKKTMQRINEKIKEVDELCSDLSKRIKETEVDMKGDDSVFLHKFKELEERVKYTVPDIQLNVAPLIDVAKQLGNLTYKVWEKMKNICPYYPVILDPATKKLNLKISGDLSSLTFERRLTPSTPEKNIKPVLGSEGFTSGTHSWEVEVGNNQQWAIGVVKESAKEKLNPPGTRMTSVYLNKSEAAWRKWLLQSRREQSSKAVMASSLSSLEEDLKCVLCQNIYKTPLILLCTHSFCKSCLEASWAERGSKECPVCKKRSSIENPPVNRALKTACDSFIQEKSRRVSEEERGLLCPQHSLNMQLFCLHDEQLVCAECVTQQHNNHNFCSIGKAASVRREELRGPLQELQANHAAFSSEKLTCLSVSQEIQETPDHCSHSAALSQSQFLHTQMQMKKEFEKLHRFLHEEEEARISALKKEMERKSQKMKERMEQMDEILASVSKRIKLIEEHMNADDSLFLKNVKDAEESAEYTVPDPELDSGALMDVAKHLGNLRYRVWEKMKDLCPYYPVILEPNTAHSSLHLSVDLIKVNCRDTKQNLPNNPERFMMHPVILGSEGFSSGTHSWVVDVGESDNWTIGVVKESIKRKDEISVSPQDGFWTISREDGTFSFNTGYCGAERVQRVRVQVNWNGGQVIFTNSESNRQLQAYSHSGEKMYPYFSTLSELPLKILPAKVTQSVNENHSENSSCSSRAWMH
ncbi:hypothetical protein AOLI_G00328820 [Acnodon oligacanthus]